jgi:hypothetical protein
MPHNNVTPQFVEDAAHSADLLVAHLHECGHENFGYIILAVQNADIANMTSCSNLPPHIMMDVLRIVADQAYAHDVTPQTRTEH